MKLTLECAHCGAAFTRYKSNHRQRGTVNSFCSRTCSYASPLRRQTIATRSLRVAPAPNLAARDIGYLAGLIDGEGSMGLTKVRGGWFNAWLIVYNTDRRLVEWCQNTTRVGRIFHMAPRGAERPAWRWVVAARGELAALLPEIIPALVSKRPQAEMLLLYCRRRLAGEPCGSDDLALKIEIMAANQRRPA